MGFFSWLTADTNRSISNRHSEYGATPVYLLQPNGGDPIYEPSYEGYGQFGSVDAHVWLAKQNRDMIKRPDSEVDAFTEDDLNSIGITLAVGNHYVDTVDGSLHTIFHDGPHLIDPAVMLHKVTYDQPIAHFGGKTGNDLIAEGRLVAQGYNPEFPLKFSQSATAVYEELPRSEDCPDQGFFYDEHDQNDGEDE